MIEIISRTRGLALKSGLMSDKYDCDVPVTVEEGSELRLSEATRAFRTLGTAPGPGWTIGKPTIR